MLTIRCINEVKNKIPKGKWDFCYVSSKEALVIGVVNEEVERFIFVARDYWEADYIPGCGWIKVEDEDEPFKEDN